VTPAPHTLLHPDALAVRAWLRRCGGLLGHEALSDKFIDRRGYELEALRDAIGVLQAAGALRWRNPSTVELVW